jgi:hypothetical protein
MKNRLFQLAGALALLAVLGKFYAVPAIAQIKTALVKNVDERGRSPYQQGIFLQCTAGGGFCDFNFPPVPAGKRLVVEHISANIFAPSGINAAFLVVSGGAYFSLPAHSFSLSSLYSVNEVVLGYYEAGQSPLFRLAPSVSDGSANAGATLTGYLVDLSL